MNYSKLISLLLVLAIASSCSKPEEKTEAVSVSKEINKIVGIARIEPEKGLLNIYAGTNGKIQSVNVEENDFVSAGKILIVLEQATDIAQLNHEQSKLVAQKFAIESSEASVSALQSDLQKVKNDLDLNEKLFAAKTISEQALNDSRAKYQKLFFDYEKQKAEASQTKNKLIELNATIDYRKAVMNEKIIKAPFSGQVLQLDVHNGDYVTSGQKLGQFAPEGAMVAIAEVDELFAGKVKAGMKADIISQTTGEKIGHGEIIFVAEFLKKKSLFSDETTVEDRRVRKVKILLSKESTVVINDRVDCKIYLK